MITLKKILVSTDFSEPSDSAVKYARAFAEQFGAEVHVLHVVEDPFLYAPTSEAYVVPPHLLEEIETAARERLDNVLPPADRERLHAQLVLRHGSPFVEIVRYARDADVDLIVMGTHGRGPIAHMLLGSVAEKVVRKAPCPVLTVRHPEHEFVMP
jgi:nucleotide-binding universal stress UspA family protein